MLSYYVGQSTLIIKQGDITNEQVDVIVNAANSQLVHGGGVAAAIARAAGPLLLEESAQVAPVKIGSVKATTAGNLPAKRVYHTVGPVWHGGTNGEERLLVSAIHSCLELLVTEGYRSIAFPAISTGIYGYPFEMAMTAILKEIHNFLKSSPPLDVRLVLFTDQDFTITTRLAE